ncbi:MAG TPA: NADH-quinone oxidoreductase subunit I [Elusimicrobia bacterium]|nr:NADH-quinone oxidoreductase subunit I [Elusimicrobiota bacterium]
MSPLERHRVVPVPRREMGLEEGVYIIEIMRGLLITSRHFFVNLWRHTLTLLGMKTEPGAVTIQYPEDPAMVARRGRTRHRLLQRADGTPRCVACLLCETVCPAKCIRIVAEESPDVMIEKRAKSFDIDIGECVFCGYCAEVCPEDAIRMDGRQVELAAHSRADMVWGMKELFGDAQKETPVRPTRDPLDP